MVRWSFQTPAEPVQAGGTCGFYGWQAQHVLVHTWGTQPVQLCWLPAISCLIHRRGLMNSLGFYLNMGLIPVKSVVLIHTLKAKCVLEKQRWLQEKNLIFSAAFCFGSSTFNQVGPTIASAFLANPPFLSWRKLTFILLSLPNQSSQI